MASTRRRTAAVLLLALLTAAGCATPSDPGAAPATEAPGTPSEHTSVGSSSGSRTPAPAGGATISIPDLSDATIDCTSVDDPCEPGDDPALDRLWQACASGDGDACDRLYYDAPFDTRYEQFGNTCGDRDVLVPCPDELP